jgi:uncharacterized membrane protein HdeD (DUF308 family)
MEVLGVLLILYGIFCLVYVGAASLASILLIGSLLLIAGVTQIAATIAFWSKGRGGFALGMILGLLSAISGILCLMYPGMGLQVLTFVMAIFFISTGMVRMTILIGDRLPGWGWGVVSAIVEILLGILILAWYPAISLVALGTIFGVQMIFSGSSALSIGMSVRQVLKAPAEEPPSPRPATRFQH